VSVTGQEQTINPSTSCCWSVNFLCSTNYKTLV